MSEMDLTFVASDLTEAIEMAQRHPEARIVFPGGAISLVADLPQHVVEQIKLDCQETLSSTSR